MKTLKLMKALDFVVSDKKIFQSIHFKTYLVVPWPTYATNWTGLNNFNRGPSRNHSCEVWSKSNKWFQMRCCLKKLLTHGRWTTDNGPSQKLTLSTLCSGVKMAFVSNDLFSSSSMNKCSWFLSSLHERRKVNPSGPVVGVTNSIHFLLENVMEWT